MSKMKEIKNMSLGELESKSLSLLKEAVKLRFQRSMGEEVQTHRYSAIRRERARIKTEISVKRAHK